MPPERKHAPMHHSPLDTPALAGQTHPRRVQVPCTFTQQDFDRFADLSGDHNPIHVDPCYAARTAFGATVAHGMLLYSRLRGLIAQEFPGCALQTQTLMFPAPSYADEALALTLDLAHDGEDGILLRMQVHKSDGRLGLDGTARIVRRLAPLPAAGYAWRSATVQTDAVTNAPDSAATGFPAFQSLRVGATASITRGYSQTDMDAWVALARQTTRPAQVSEPLIAALFSYLLGEKTPGHGTNYLKQSMTFHAAAHIDERLNARVAITRLRPDKALVNLATHCTGEDGRLLCTGEALVLFKC